MDFEDSVEAAVETLPDDLREAMSNVAIVVEDEPPRGRGPLLGLYHGIPHTGPHVGYYAGVRARPDLASIAAPSSGYYGRDPEPCCSAQVRRAVLHEIAHHFGISDERLVELDRY